MDLAYIPNHCSGKNTDPEFFKRVRASYYVVSGNDAANGEPSRAVLDALLEGKSQWGENLQVGHGNTKGCVMLLIPQVLRRKWVSQTYPREYTERKQMVVGISSFTVSAEYLLVLMRRRTPAKWYEWKQICSLFHILLRGGSIERSYTPYLPQDEPILKQNQAPTQTEFSSVSHTQWHLLLAWLAGDFSDSNLLIELLNKNVL